MVSIGYPTFLYAVRFTGHAGQYELCLRSVCWRHCHLPDLLLCPWEKALRWSSGRRRR